MHVACAPRRSAAAPGADAASKRGALLPAGLWLLVAYLTAGEPLVGVVVARRLRAGALSRPAVYRLIIAMEIALAALAFGAALATGASPAGVGLRLGNYRTLPGVAVGLAAGAAAGTLCAFALGLVASRRARPSGTARAVRRIGDFDHFLPATSAERRLFAVMALAAGVCEELVYRGFLIYALNRGLPGLGAPDLVVAAALLFGLGHAYQGGLGMLGTAVIGGLMGAIYVATGSLLVPMAVHALIDLRVLALPVAPPAAPAAAVGT